MTVRYVSAGNANFLVLLFLCLVGTCTSFQSMLFSTKVSQRSSKVGRLAVRTRSSADIKMLLGGSHSDRLRNSIPEDDDWNNSQEGTSVPIARDSFLRSISAFFLAASSSLPAHADTCTRKDCQPQANFLPEGDTPTKKDIMPMPGLDGKDYGKTRMKYPDYTSTSSGLQYKDAKVGSGDAPVDGDRVVIDWEGYTIGYYGRIFQAKNKVQGGAFQGDPGFYRYVLGTGALIPGLEEGIKGMKPGGVRQIVVGPELGYPPDDSGHNRVGPRPLTFDGMRALNFVLENKGLIDKTLLFNVKLVRVDKATAEGFVRGDQ